MTDPSEYTPPKVWSWSKENGGRFANINRPIAGPTHDKELPVGHHPLQLYSLATPNGVKVTVMFEELLRRLPDIEITGEPAMLQSGFIHGIKRMPCAWKTVRT